VLRERRPERQQQPERGHEGGLRERRQRHPQALVEQQEHRLAGDGGQHERVADGAALARGGRVARRDDHRSDADAGQRDREHQPSAEPLAQHHGADERADRRQAARDHAGVRGRRRPQARHQQHGVADAAAQRLQRDQAHVVPRRPRQALALPAHQRQEDGQRDREAQRRRSERRQAGRDEAARDDGAAHRDHGQREEDATREAAGGRKNGCGGVHAPHGRRAGRGGLERYCAARAAAALSAGSARTPPA
jgi:hypothetical protein